MNISRPACRAYSPPATSRAGRTPIAASSCGSSTESWPADRARRRVATCSDNGSAFPMRRSSGASTTTFPSTTSGMPRRGTGSTSRAASRRATASYAIAATARCWPWPQFSAIPRISKKRRRWSTFARERDRACRSAGGGAGCARDRRARLPRRKLRPSRKVGRGEPHEDGQPEKTRAGKRDDEGAALAKLHEDRGHEQSLGRGDSERDRGIERSQPLISERDRQGQQREQPEESPQQD